MCQTQMNSVLNTDSKWRPKLQKTIAFNHYTVRDTRVCVCACVRMLGVFIFEQIGCSNTAHFAFKTHHVPWTRKWMLQPRWGVCTFHIMLFTLSDLTKHWFYALSNKAKCTWTVQSEQYWWGGGVGISFWGHDHDLILLTGWNPGWLLWPVRGFPLFMSWSWATLTAGSEPLSGLGSTLENSGRVNDRWKVR